MKTTVICILTIAAGVVTSLAGCHISIDPWSEVAFLTGLALCAGILIYWFVDVFKQSNKEIEYLRDEPNELFVKGCDPVQDGDCHKLNKRNPYTALADHLGLKKSAGKENEYTDSEGQIFYKSKYGFRPKYSRKAKK